ncbi:MAG: aminoglycoside phosphotransferase family protein [Clostridiales bacterium]|nr:aminoglycoside phosphotransferase family protein [Clostridiales bacterium]
MIAAQSIGAEGFLLYNQPEDIIGQYDFAVGQITKGRGSSYICESDTGTKILVPYAGSAEKAGFLKEYLAYLKDAGFPCEQILLTQTGEEICVDAYGGKYLCKDMVDGSECSTRNRQEMNEAAKILAFYHKVSAGCPLKAPDGMVSRQKSLASTYAGRTRQMLRVRNYIRDKNKKGEFELCFLQYYPHFAKQAMSSEELLGSMDGGLGRILVHGDIDQHNIIKTADGWRIINFEHLEYSWRMADLANFLRKMMEKNNWRRELGLELVAAYDSVERIRETDRMLLYILMCYPEKFRKLANHYLNSHKPWLSARSLEKLNRLAAQEQAREAFLDDLNKSFCLR